MSQFECLFSALGEAPEALHHIFKHTSSCLRLRVLLDLRGPSVQNQNQNQAGLLLVLDLFYGCDGETLSSLSLLKDA